MSFTASAKQTPCFALIDCNNFYVSCERLFRPDLRERPVIVASNNDGCAVARSAETKALGIRMGTPLFKIDELIREHRIEVFSSNYALYADISNRVMSTIESMVPQLEIYSIDEAFADLKGIKSAISLDAFGHQIRNKVDKWVGIPTCVGIAPTKTLAKLANYGAKKYPKTGGVVDLSELTRQQKLMAITPVSEVWGVGKRISERLNQMGIQTALDLAKTDLKPLREQFSVVLERTARELRGEPCLALETMPTAKKQIVVSRSFGTPVAELEGIQSALASFIARAAEKLRSEHQAARQLTVFIRTNPFKQSQPQDNKTITHTLRQPTQDSRKLLAITHDISELIYREGYNYTKAGVMLADFYEPGVFQQSLFESDDGHCKNPELMEVLDKLNNKKPGTLYFASQKKSNGWHMKREKLSPAYTTSWDDLPKVN